MLKSDFYYELPEELIAQTPLEPRDSSRLMVISRANGTITHSHFYNIADFLDKGDLLVVNNSKVFPARLFGKTQNGKLVQLLLLEPKKVAKGVQPNTPRVPEPKKIAKGVQQNTQCVWECLVYPGRQLRKGAKAAFPRGLSAEITDVLENGNRIVTFDYSQSGETDFYSLLDKIGNMPLPHYITEKLEDNGRYNTVYAAEVGSVAAPTAGLHFTDKVFQSLSEKGIETAKTTLHVGVGTFRPVKTEKIEEHKMHSENYYIPYDTVQKAIQCKQRGNRVVAVGTTSCRALESNAGLWGLPDYLKMTEEIGGNVGSTDIFITPGYKFKAIDALITNFHLPESTLLMLVSAFMGREAALAAYNEAIKEKYRFYSFGDCMLIL